MIAVWLAVAACAAGAQELPAPSQPAEAPPPGTRAEPGQSPQTPGVASTPQPAAPKPTVAQELRDRIEDLLRRREFAGALKLIDQALAQEGGNAALLLMRAQADCRFGRLDACLEDAGRALEADKDLVPAYLLRANARLDRGRPADALADCEAIMRLVPEEPIGYGCRGRVHRALRNYPQALADLDEALRRNARYWAALFDKGSVYALLGQPQQAIATYTAVIELNEKHDEAYAQRGTLRIAAGDVEGARTDFARALALNGRNHTAAVGAQALHVARALDALATKK